MVTSLNVLLWYWIQSGCKSAPHLFDSFPTCSLCGPPSKYHPSPSLLDLLEAILVPCGFKGKLGLIRAKMLSFCTSDFLWLKTSRPLKSDLPQRVEGSHTYVLAAWTIPAGIPSQWKWLAQVRSLTIHVNPRSWARCRVILGLEQNTSL